MCMYLCMYVSMYVCATLATGAVALGAAGWALLRSRGWCGARAPRAHETSTTVGFEPTRGDLIGAECRRRSHSAKVSMSI